MAFLTLGGVSLKVLALRRGPDELGGGPAVERTLSGQLRGSPHWRARNWTAEVRALDDSAAVAIYTQADGVSTRSLTGDALPAAVSVKASVEGDGYQRMPDSSWRRVLTLALRETLE